MTGSPAPGDQVLDRPASARVAAPRSGAATRLDTGQRARLCGWLTAAAAASTGSMVACYLVLVRTSLGQRVDDAGLVGAYDQLPQTRAADVTSLQRITADSFLAVLVVIAVIGAVRRRPRLGVAMASTAGLTVALTDVLKHDVLTRPLLTADTVNPMNSFPSGHTAAALAVALALVVVAPARWRGVAVVVAGSYGWVTAVQVQTTGWHRLSDALGAALFSVALVCLACAVLVRWRPVTRIPARHPFAAAILAAVWLLFTGLGLVESWRVLRVLAGSSARASLTTAVAGDAYHLSVDLTVVVVVSLLAVLLALLRGIELDQPRPHPSRSLTRWRRG